MTVHLMTQGYHKGIDLFRKVTSPLRILPHFIIFGVGRCGTTSLYNYLAEHPNVGEAQEKEIFFFDYHFDQGLSWYKKYFPLKVQGYGKTPWVTGDATPSYMHHPLAPSRIKEILPQVKLILLLRNPVDRAYSHYCQKINAQLETFPFEMAVRHQIAERTFFQKEHILGNEQYFRHVYYPHAYISKGVYIENIARWFNTFPKQHILVLQNEEMSKKPQRVFQKTLEFLELPPWELKEFKQYNYHGDHYSAPRSDKSSHKAKYEPLTSSFRQELAEYFKPYNEQLYEFLGTDLGWENKT